MNLVVPTHPPIISLMCSTELFFFKFLRLIPVLRYSVVCCGHRVGVLLVVGVGRGKAAHVVCCAESQITGSPPLLSDWDILCDMDHEGQSASLGKRTPPCPGFCLSSLV